VRLGLAVAATAGLLSLVDNRGAAHFRSPHVLTEPNAWLLHALMLIAFVILVGAITCEVAGQRTARRARVIALLALGGTVAVAGVLGQLVYSSVWGFSLADLVWWFDVVMLSMELIAFALAIAIGTPGCEIGVWPELIARLRGKRSAGVSRLACIIGLHVLDNWEAGRQEVRRSNSAG
jgi:hypothetical protein